MKKISFFCRLTALAVSLLLSSSCRSIETMPPAPTATRTSAVTETTVTGISVGGVPIGGAAVTVASAVPFPDAPGESVTVSVSGTEDPDDSSEPAAIEEESPAPDETTTAAAQTTTSSAAQTTTTSDAATTTTTTTTAATTAATTTTTAAITTTTAATTIAATTAPVTKAAPGSGSYGKNSYKALNHTRVKAVWISYIELANHLNGKGETAFREEFGRMLDKCTDFGINTVYVHVRAFGDAYYYSSLFPFTKHISGSLGTKTSYDPLKIMVAEAHKRSVSFHAWINPLRLGSAADVAATSADYPVGKWYAGAEKGTYIVNVNGTYYLNPAYSEVRQLIGDNVREIVSGYDVDGVHIDDYFYPTTDASFDSAAFAASGYGSLSAFRIHNCSEMVKAMYNAAHECGSAVFGAAPQGNNINNLNMLYADTKAWCSGGYIDYFTPQIYYGFENSGVPFESNVKEWAGIVAGTKTKLYAGLAVYKAGTEDKWAGTGKTEWQNTTTMLKRQTEFAEKNGCGGIALYSYAYLFDSGYANAATQAEAENLKPLLKS